MDLVVELILSWLALWFFEKKNLSVLGIKPTKTRMMNLFTGFLIASFLCAFNYFLQTVFSGSTWHLNSGFTWKSFFSAAWWTLHSVLYEELIFRGALLYIAIKKLGEKRACLLSAICFGVYHLFSMSVSGWVPVIYLVAATTLMGFVFALAYTKTNSLYLPVGLHFGWNMLTTVIFSQGPIGNQFLILKAGERFSPLENSIVLIWSAFALPLASFLYLKRIKENQPESKSETIII
ncbi:lysostaphin resistance A-like protein [Rubrolithibacter danxiaensis]|uniref:CPBP family intramembrane glutamic endopeptidase n=1 Tax=Rubrolithibacter danxiaensis TaxID=3390805 RepID=UPI003BF8F111